MSINLSALMKQRYDTAANWTAQNPMLLAGEIGIESDTKKWKVGTGATAWTSLAYAIGGTYPIVNADIAAGAEIAVSKLADGSARQLLQTDAAGTGVEWTSDVSIPGALSVTGNVNIDGGTLYVDAANNRVGIGTSNSSAGLCVGLGGTTIPTAGSTTGSALFGNATSPGLYGLVVGATTTGLGYIQAQRADGTATTYDLTLQPNGGNVGIGTMASNANGGILQLSSGITFPATAVAASDANTLDDYEEGTWTGTDASGAGLSIVLTGAKYTKIGRLVYVSADTITYPTTASTATAQLGGLPFTNSAVFGGSTALISSNLDANRALVLPSSTAVQFYQSVLGATPSTNAQLTGAVIYGFSIFYQV